MDLKDKTQLLLSLRAEIDKLNMEYEDRLAPLKASKETLQTEILAEMAKNGTFSERYAFATVTRAVRKTLKVVDEAKLVKHLKKVGLTDYIKETVNELFDSVKKEAIKNDKKLPGTEITETEFISLRSAEEGDKRKVVTA